MPPSVGSLKEYHRKRHFAKTAEPEGRQRIIKGKSYLIQKHVAHRLHYDFRLEMGGVLKSWAVPKGPSLRTSDHRLAVHVEDHPVEYGKFEGTIPKPEYGAGTVMLWDRGTWEPVGDGEEGYRRGKLKFRLHGERLQGLWTLVRMHTQDGSDKNWLLIKDKDELANGGDPVQELQTSVVTGRSMDEITHGKSATWTRATKKAPPLQAKSAKKSPKKTQTDLGTPAPMPETFHPQLATLVNEAPTGDEWIHELKFDGYRILAFLQDGKARLMTRNGNDWTEKFSSVAHNAELLPAESAIIDGEVVIQKEDGTTDFQLLQNYLKGKKKHALVYEVFDLPYLNGRDLTSAPLRERKAALKNLVESAGEKISAGIRSSEHLSGQGKTVYRSACQHALEGIISKRLDSIYVQDRSSDWLKVKCIKQQEFVIGGYTGPTGARQHFGSLIIGTYDDKGQLICHGHVGTGFNEASLDQIYNELKKYHQDKSPFSTRVENKSGRPVTWVKPVLVCEVAFTGWTDGGNCRHPAFIGLREDKKAEEVHVEKPQDLEAARVKPERHVVRRRADNSESVGGVKLTHPDKILYAEQNITKRDLAAYYDTVADYILPHLKGRPLVLVRCPSGQEKACFYQKHAADAPETLRRITIEEKSTKGDYLLVDNKEGLIGLAQMAALELHVWGSTEDNLEKPDRMVIDLDPAPDTPWKKTVAAAQRMKNILDSLSLQSFVKTTGGKGLHVVVPFEPELEWDAFKELSKAISSLLYQDYPNDYVLKSSKALRPGKIFVDYLRNGRGATSVAPYSTRAKPGATVSMPISWDELTSIKPAGFNVRMGLERLGKQKKDPWEGFFEVRQKISKVNKLLAK